MLSALVVSAVMIGQAPSAQDGHQELRKAPPAGYQSYQSYQSFESHHYAPPVVTGGSCGSCGIQMHAPVAVYQEVYALPVRGRYKEKFVFKSTARGGLLRGF